VAILISFLGILLIIQPEFLFGKSGDVNLYCCIIVLTAAFLNSFSMVILRLLKGLVTNDTALQYFYLGQIFVNGLILVSEGDTDLHH
jgi:drug/metabolite transporter (DMT)-like permease